MLQQHAATILDRMIRKAMRDKPQAVIFVDKTPLAALMTHEIHSILPDVRFLMMTRDPLDVVASWRRSSRHLGAVDEHKARRERGADCGGIPGGCRARTPKSHRRRSDGRLGPGAVR